MAGTPYRGALPVDKTALLFTMPAWAPTGWGALHHGIRADDTLHALSHPIRIWPLDAEPPERPDERVLVIGATQTGQLLEIVYVPSDTEHRVIHSMKLRPSTQADFL